MKIVSLLVSLIYHLEIHDVVIRLRDQEGSYFHSLFPVRQESYSDIEASRETK